MDALPSISKNDLLLVNELGNMITMMGQSIGQYSSVEMLFLESQRYGNRKRAVQWMKEVAAGFRLGSDARDCGIQIFDKFLALIVHEKEEKNHYPLTVRDPFNYTLSNFTAMYLGRNKLNLWAEEELDPNIVSYAAAVSIILGSKLHESKGELTLTSFQDFDIGALKYFEKVLLKKIYFSISPQVTPYSFIRKFLQIWQFENENTELIKIADSLVSDFWEESSSMLFAPSTIAIAALILSFSILRMDCTNWLCSIPNFCLPLSEENPFRESHNSCSIENNHSSQSDCQLQIDESRHSDSTQYNKSLDQNKNKNPNPSYLSCSNSYETCTQHHVSYVHLNSNSNLNCGDSGGQQQQQQHQQYQSQNNYQNHNKQYSNHQYNQNNNQNQQKKGIHHITNINLNRFNTKHNRNFRFFDIDNCLNCFSPVEAKYSREKATKNVLNVSPTSVAAISKYDKNDDNVIYKYEYHDFSLSVDNTDYKSVGSREKKKNDDIGVVFLGSDEEVHINYDWNEYKNMSDKNDNNNNNNNMNDNIVNKNNNSNSTTDDNTDYKLNYNKKNRSNSKISIKSKNDTNNGTKNDINSTRNNNDTIINDSDNINLNDNMNNNGNKRINNKRSVSLNNLESIKKKRPKVYVCQSGELDTPVHSNGRNNFSNIFDENDHIDKRLRKRIIFDNLDNNNDINCNINDNNNYDDSNSNSNSNNVNNFDNLIDRKDINCYKDSDDTNNNNGNSKNVNNIRNEIAIKLLSDEIQIKIP